MLDRLFLLHELDRKVRLPAPAVIKAEALYEKLITLLVLEMSLEDARGLGEGPKAALRAFLEEAMPAADLKKTLRRWDPHASPAKDAGEAMLRRELTDLLDQRREPRAAPEPKPPRRAQPAQPPAAPAAAPQGRKHPFASLFSRRS